MKKVYPVILTPVNIGEKDGYTVYVPDLGIDTQGYGVSLRLTPSHSPNGYNLMLSL